MFSLKVSPDRGGGGGGGSDGGGGDGSSGSFRGCLLLQREWLMRRRSYGDSVSERNREQILHRARRLKVRRVRAFPMDYRLRFISGMRSETKSRQLRQLMPSLSPRIRRHAERCASAVHAVYVTSAWSILLVVLFVAAAAVELCLFAIFRPMLFSVCLYIFVSCVVRSMFLEET